MPVCVRGSSSFLVPMSINTPVKRKHKPYDILQNERNISTSPVKTAETVKKYRRNDRRYFLVEVTGLEPTTSWSLTKRATKLRYTSIKSISYYINYSLCVKRFFCPQTKFLAKSQILNVMRPHIMWGALYSEKTSRRTCKPGSVERGHLSTLTVADKLKRYLRLYSGGQPI